MLESSSIPLDISSLVDIIAPNLIAYIDIVDSICILELDLVHLLMSEAGFIAASPSR
jgi:hypothetical protein